MLLCLKQTQNCKFLDEKLKNKVKTAIWVPSPSLLPMCVDVIYKTGWFFKKPLPPRTGFHSKSDLDGEE